MGFEDDPKDEIESYPCDCGGEITEGPDGWFCDNCNWISDSETNDRINDDSY